MEFLRQRLARAYRIVATGFSFAVFGIGAIIIALILQVSVFPLPIARAKKQRIARCCIWRGSRFYINMMRGLGLLTYSFEGTIDQSTSNTLIVANHPSLLDAIFILSAMPDINCIAKAALCKNLFTRGIFALAGYIPNSGDGETLLAHAADAVSSGQNLLVFPEGTRRHLDWPLEFRRGAAHIALRSKCTIVPVIITCTPPTLQKYEKWYQVPASSPHFRLRIMPPLTLDHGRYSHLPITRQVRRLTEALEAYFKEQLGKDRCHN